MKTILHTHQYQTKGTIKDPEDCIEVVGPQNTFIFKNKILLIEVGSGKERLIIFTIEAGKDAMCIRHLRNI